MRSRSAMLLACLLVGGCAATTSPAQPATPTASPGTPASTAASVPAGDATATTDGGRVVATPAPSSTTQGSTPAPTIGPGTPSPTPRPPSPEPGVDPASRPADQVSGTVGPFTLPDTKAKPGANCTYDRGHPRRRVFVPVPMPLVYWPNRNPNVSNEHGTVGWQVSLLMADTPSGKWNVVYVSSTTKATASESRAADMFKLAINWHVSSRVHWRIRVKMFWYNPGGSTMGWVKHTVWWYRLAIAKRPWSPTSVGGWEIGKTLSKSDGSCPNRLPNP